MGAFFFRSGFAHVDNVIPVIKTITWLLLHGCKATNHTGTLRNLPSPASGTYTNTRRNSPEPSGTFLRNLLLRPAPAHTGAYLG